MVPEEASELPGAVLAEEDRNNGFSLLSDVLCNDSPSVMTPHIAKSVFNKVKSKLSRFIEQEIFARFGLLDKLTLVPRCVIKQNDIPPVEW